MLLKTSKALLSEDHTADTKLDAISELIEGFETPLGLELLATTHWAHNHEGKRTVGEIEEFCKDWNARKSQFTRRQIAIALEHLGEKGWIKL